MNRVYKEELEFHNLNFQVSPLQTGDYENCIFTNCDFSNADLNETNFLECKFQDCNLSLSNLRPTSLKDVEFNNCKLLGLHFEECNRMMITFTFKKCSDENGLYNLTLTKAIFSPFLDTDSIPLFDLKLISARSGRR